MQQNSHQQEKRQWFKEYRRQKGGDTMVNKEQWQWGGRNWGDDLVATRMAEGATSMEGGVLTRKVARR
jgi:hypothetical protein